MERGRLSAAPSAPPAAGWPQAAADRPAAQHQDVAFQTLLVPVDNSAYSSWATEVALQIGKAFDATVVGHHVYAAHLHERRFSDMEPGLPDEYQEPRILAHQRDVHATLIEKGLKLIAESYLETLKRCCQQDGLRFIAKTAEGKNYAELVRDIEASGYDLVIMGARGMGEAWRRGGRQEQVLGSVCERVVRRVTRDVLVVKNGRPLGGTFVVGVDGSARGFAALRVALSLARAMAADVQVVAAYDPFLHKAVFHKLENVLTDEAKNLFNSEVQRKLHDELVDGGIARLYASHLETARRLAADAGIGIETHLLTGKAYVAILRHVTRVQPTVLVLGRTGLHADEGLDIGATAENLLRLASCHVLMVGRAFAPTWTKVRAIIEEHVAWTPEALARLERVPAFVRAMVRKAIEDYARLEGRDVVDERVVQEARRQFGG